VLTKLMAAAILAGVFSAALFDPPLTAQTKKQKQEDAAARSLEGVVLDAQENLVPDAVVKLEDMRTLQVRSFFTKEDGKYHFSGLKPDVEYQVRADFQDSTSGWKRLSIFDTRKVASINLKLAKVQKDK
jgi:protocatechuate 3,4-dioxygenase beta subunit